MATRMTRKLIKTTQLNEERGEIDFSPVFRPQPEAGYWLVLALAFSDIELANQAGRLGPLSGAEAGTESLKVWRDYQNQLLGVLSALLRSRPDMLDAAESESLQEKLGMTKRIEVPNWPTVQAAATALVRDENLAISSLKPLQFDANSRKDKVFASAINAAMDAYGIEACIVCETPFITTARSRLYCSPACRKAASIAPKEGK